MKLPFYPSNHGLFQCLQKKGQKNKVGQDDQQYYKVGQNGPYPLPSPLTPPPI